MYPHWVSSYFILTTYAGSEMNPILEKTAEGRKTSGRNTKDSCAKRALPIALPEILEEPSVHPAQPNALYGAELCGTRSVTLHHILCHTLGGSLNLRTVKPILSFYLHAFIQCTEDRRAFDATDRKPYRTAAEMLSEA